VVFSRPRSTSSGSAGLVLQGPKPSRCWAKFSRPFGTGPDIPLDDWFAFGLLANRVRNDSFESDFQRPRAIAGVDSKRTIRKTLSLEYGMLVDEEKPIVGLPPDFL
jgi:hypothetical protein